MIYDAVVIGAGVVGSMTARELTRNGFKVCVVEKGSDAAMGATKANSAIVHAGFDAEECSLKARLNVEGSCLMPDVAKELGVKYIRNGSIVVAFDDNDRKIVNDLFLRGKANGVKGLEIIEKDRLKEIEPNISDDAICALYAPTGAIICPYELTFAALGNAMDNGAEFRTNFEVKGIAFKDDIYLVTDGNECIETRTVINAAGLYADRIAQMAGDDSFKITPRRGEYILLDKTAGALAKQTVFCTPTKMGKGILVSPTVDGNLLLGPTSENIEDKEDKATTMEGFDKIISGCNKTLSGIPLAKTITSFCGLRAAGDTGDFIITSPKKGFVNLAGIESPGLSASPAIAKYAVNMLKEQGFELTEREDFNPIRPSLTEFKNMSIDEKNEIIKEDSSYGKIICRCEGVTEGEILKAIRTNPKPSDLDGVKRRTRAQMGRCQGGFCMPYIMELLAKEQEVSMEDITKSGGNSKVIVGRKGIK